MHFDPRETRTMSAAATLLGLIPLGLGGYHVSRSAFGMPKGLPGIFGAFVLAWTWLTLGTLGLGLLGWLARGPLIAWSASGYLLGLFVSRRGVKDVPRTGLVSDGAWGVDAACAVGLALWAIIAMGVPSLLLPVKVMSDGPIYHLYFAARWWQAGRIFLIPTPFGENAAPYFPANGDVWHTWLFVVWGGERLAKIGQVPFLILSVAIVYDLARRLGAGPSAAAVGASWFASVSPVLVFSLEPVVDTIFIAGYLLAFYFAARFALGDDGTGSLVLSGIAAGAAWGTKAPGVVFIPPLVMVVAGLAVARRGPISIRLRNAAIVLVCSFLLEGFWLIRNAWLTGNPLYPLHITAFGRTLLPGWYGPGAMQQSGYYAAPGEWRVFIDMILVVFDPRLIPVWAAALAGAWKIGRMPAREDRVVWACSLFALLNIALYWLVIPYRSQQRFMLHATALAAVPVSLLFDRWRWVRAAGVLLLAIHVLTPQNWPFAGPGASPPWDLSPDVPNSPAPPIPFWRDVEAIQSPAEELGRWGGATLLLVGVACLGSGLLADWARTGGGWRWLVPAAAACLAGLGQALILETRKADAIAFRFPYFPDYLAGWADLDSRLGRSSARIAYAGTNLPYYLMGPDFRNEVRYINIDAHPDWLLHDYHRAAASRGLPEIWQDTRPGWDRLRPDYDAWLSNLEVQRIQLLVVTKANAAEGWFNPMDQEGFPIERLWADAHPDRFVRLYSDPLFRLYAIRPSRKKIPGSTDSPARPHT